MRAGNSRPRDYKVIHYNERKTVFRLDDVFDNNFPSVHCTARGVRLQCQ